MIVGSVAFMLADVVVAVEAIAPVAARFDRIVAGGHPVFAIEMLRDGGIAGLVILKMHTNSPLSRAQG